MSPLERSSVALSASLAPPDLEHAIAALGPEPRSCPVCACAKLTRSFRRSEKWFWRCLGCELVFVHDIFPEFLEEADLGLVYGFDRPLAAGPRKERKYEALLARLEAFRGQGRMLEVGCGQGLFLQHARSRGWSVRGVEILPPMVALAQARGLEVFLGTLEEARLAAASADVVVLREVIEHIVDPIPLLIEIRRVLCPGGVAVLCTGNARSWAARLRGERWPYYRFGGHMHIRFWSPKSAAALGRAAGFERVECHTNGFAFRESEELRGRWYKPLVKLAQAPLSPLATACGAGHRLVILCYRTSAREA
jgi:SAM-dependent methyltransferase